MRSDARDVVVIIWRLTKLNCFWSWTKLNWRQTNPRKKKPGAVLDRQWHAIGYFRYQNLKKLPICPTRGSAFPLKNPFCRMKEKFRQNTGCMLEATCNFTAIIRPRRPLRWSREHVGRLRCCGLGRAKYNPDAQPVQPRQRV